jgi:predicted NBD/HSP70 family sugar kinase
VHALGIELTDRAARAVVVDEDGTILRRVERRDADAAAAAQAAASDARQKGAVDHAGVAVHDGSRHRVEDLGLPRSIGVRVFGAGLAAVAAESWRGAAQNVSHAICLVIGDQVLAGLLLDGRPWAGAHGLAGSAAWLALNPVERRDYRKLGCLAAEISSTGIARRLTWRIQAGDHSAVLERAGNLAAVTAAHVFDGARAGDGVAISVVRDTAKYIGMAVANLASALDPEVVVLGGAIAAAGDLLLEPTRQECARRLSPAMVDAFRCEMSPFGEDGIAIGAARLAMPDVR